MKNYKGYRLYVNLGPSKVRKRLKGHGFGVKKVQSAGTNQAVIIHTATGEHLRQLKSLFTDVLPPPLPPAPPADAASDVAAESVPNGPDVSKPISTFARLTT
jgi:hypothetical protein